MYQLFYRFYKWVNRHRSLSIGLALISLLVGFFIISSLKIEDDITKILPKSEQGNITTKVFQQQNFSDKITVLVQKKNGGNDEQLIDAAEAIELELEKYKNSIISIQGVQNEEILEDAFTMVYNHLPNFLSDDDYTIIEQKINQDSIRALTQTNYERLTSPAGIISRNFILKDPLGLTFLGMKKLQEMSSMSDLLYQDGYLFTQDKSTLLLFINPKHKSGDTQNNAAFVEGIKEIESKINKEFTHINVQFFGAPIIAVANAKQIKSDIIKTIAISMSFLVVLLMFFYRKISIPLILFIPTVFGFTTALVIIYFIRKEVSAISISIGAVLLGITIDYALHMMTHFREKQSVEILYKEITQPILMSCLTTATAFICLVFLHSDALIDLGIFAFITVLMSGIFTLLFIPHLYRPRLAKSEEKTTFIDRFASLSFDQNKPLIFVTLVLVIVSLFTFSSVKFNQDLSSLNYTPEDQLKAEKTLSQKTSMMQSSLYLVNYGSSLEEVLEES
ncbi:MMPL family transporter, partial [Weeksella sp. HMSC059D05]